MQNIEIPITKRVFERLCKRDCEDPNGNLPFIFREKDEEENNTFDHVFLVVHGAKEGGVLNAYENTIQPVSEFIRFMKKKINKLNKFEEIVLVCCHGAAQEQVKGVTILNKSNSEIHTTNSKMCAYFTEEGDMAYSFTISGIDGAFY